MLRDEKPAVEYLERAVAEFQSDARAPGLLRRLAREYPDLFFASAARHLESGEESSAHRLLAHLLIGLESFFERLTDPARCSCESAVRLFRRLLTVDPSLDIKLARMMPGREDSDSRRTLSGGSVARAMDILDQTSPGRRLMSVIRHLPESGDARISSKAALFVGRRVNNPAWTARHLSNENPRLRANAVEASWGTKSDDAIRLMEDCAADPNPRVAGNALIGLHLAGCPNVQDRAIAMSESAEPGLRSTAAWAMGRIGDRAFLGRLTALLKDENPQVRSTAVRALVEVGRAEKKRAAAIAARGEGREERVAEVAVAQPSTQQPEAQAEAPVEAQVEAPVEVPVPQPLFEISLDGSSFRAGKRR